MRVLVTYATRHGATAGIAQRIGDVLEQKGIETDVHPVADAKLMERGGHLNRYDAFVVGSAIYAFHWLSDAKDFVRRNEEVLSARPVWLFGSGPVGDKTMDDKGHDLTEPPTEMAGLAERVRARQSQVFFGAYDPAAKPVGFMEQVMHAIPAARDALPSGDFRNWSDIEEWAEAIAHDLRRAPVAV